MLDLQTCTEIGQRAFLQRLITVAVATGDTDDYLSHYNMVVDGQDQVLHNIAVDPILAPIMGLKLVHDDVVRDGSYITEPEEPMEPHRLSEFLFYDEDHGAEPIARGQHMFLCRIHTLLYALDVGIALDNTSTCDDWVQLLSRNYDLICNRTNQTLNAGNAIRLTFESVVE